MLHDLKVNGGKGMEAETDQEKNITDIHTHICNVFRNKRIMRGLQKRSVHICHFVVYIFQ